MRKQVKRGKKELGYEGGKERQILENMFSARIGRVRITDLPC